MTKIRVTCPECGHPHTAIIQGRRGTVAGVRSRRIGQSQFEHTINIPGEIQEFERYYSTADQLLLGAAVGLSFGAVGGFIAGQVIYPDYGVQFVTWGATIGLLYMWRLIYLERLWQWFERIPQAVDLYLKLPKGAQADGEGVTLTVDHRHRDGMTQAGRTVQYFGALPVDVARFNEWARAALRGDSLGIAHWTGAGKLFSRPEYDKLLETMRQAGAVINLPGKGNLLTGGGRRALGLHLKQYKEIL